MSSTPPLAAPATPAPEAPSLPLPPRGPIGRRTRAFAVLAVLGAFAGSYLGLRLADRQAAPAARASGALQGAVFAVSRGAADKAGGFTITPPGGTAQTAGPKAQVGPGSVLKTDARTRARVKLADGTDLVLDRGSELVLEAQARTARLVEGSALIEAASVAGAPPLTVRTALGDARVLGTKLVVTTSADRTNVEVLRGEVEVQGAGQGDGTAKVLAGQEAVLTKAARPEVVPATDLARRTAFGEALVAHNEDTEGDTGGLGELRAKRPGKTDEKDRVVRLARHDVKVRIAGAVARTEIEEVFTNESDDELEGLYRFPLPPGAQMERLALDVDGKLVEGEFVDAARAQAIWRGVIQHAAPSAPKPREEWVWVPGPWRDPALLEWKRGGRFELKIFPIPKRGSRRVVLAYTEAIAPSAGLRRYTYPLPHTTSSDMVIEQFHVDARVLGSDKPASVQPRGYELTRSEQGGAVALSTEARSFRPSGDLVIEYSLGDQRSPLSAHAFATPAAGGKPGERFAAIALRPQLPKWTDVRPRDQVIVVDSGRSMFGERFRRARRLAVEMAQEMDRRDRVTVMTCDMRCRPLAAGLIGPGSTASHDVDAFLSGVTPDGASDLVGAVREASRVAGRDGSRDLRVTLLSGGHATAGHRATDRVADEVRDAVGDLAHTSVLAVPIGGDSDVTFLSEVARGGGGVVLPYQPGERLATAALDVLNASYGTVLRDATLTLPEGLVDAAPGVLPPLRGGGETLVGVRMLRDRVEGEIVLRGTVGGEPFEQRTPVTLTATDAPGNAFVPRVFAANRIADREREAGDAGKTELIELSKRFLVPSRFTSLLVLESEAMFQAFGIQRGGNTQVRWTGDDLATGLIAGTKSAETEKDDSHDLGGAMELKVPAGAGGFGALAGPSPTSPAPAPPADAPAAKPKAEAFGGASRADEAPRKGAPWQPSMPPPPRGRGEWMKRVWRRTAAVTEGRGAVVPGDKLSAARSALAAAPDERNKHRDLARLLAVQGELSELDDVLTKWNERDPLDADAIAWRADLSARRRPRRRAPCADGRPRLDHGVAPRSVARRSRGGGGLRASPRSSGLRASNHGERAATRRRRSGRAGGPLRRGPRARAFGHAPSQGVPGGEARGAGGRAREDRLREGRHGPRRHRHQRELGGRRRPRSGLARPHGSPRVVRVSAPWRPRGRSDGPWPRRARCVQRQTRRVPRGGDARDARRGAPHLGDREDLLGWQRQADALRVDRRQRRGGARRRPLRGDPRLRVGGSLGATDSLGDRRAPVRSRLRLGCALACEPPVVRAPERSDRRGARHRRVLTGGLRQLRRGGRRPVPRDGHRGVHQRSLPRHPSRAVRRRARLDRQDVHPALGAVGGVTSDTLVSNLVLFRRVGH